MRKRQDRSPLPESGHRVLMNAARNCGGWSVMPESGPLAATETDHSSARLAGVVGRHQAICGVRAVAFRIAHCALHPFDAGRLALTERRRLCRIDHVDFTYPLPSTTVAGWGIFQLADSGCEKCR